MSATLDYEIKKALPFLTKDNRWNVLTVLILHANIRNRCWPSIETIANMATNGNRNRATRAKNWLQRHGAFTLVPNNKRIEEETHLNGKQLIYQLTGVVRCCGDVKCHCKADGKVYHYLYKTIANGDAYSIQTDTSDTRSIQSDTTHSMNGDTMRSTNGDTLSITNEVLPNEVLDAPKSRRKSDPEFDVIALVWETDAGGWVSNIQGQLFHSKKVKGSWDKCKVIPPATVDEVKAFGEYSTNRAKDGKVPTQPDTIQKWFSDFRKETEKRKNVAVNVIAFNPDEWVTPELESA